MYHRKTLFKPAEPDIFLIEFRQRNHYHYLHRSSCRTNIINSKSMLITLRTCYPGIISVYINQKSSEDSY